LCKERIKWCTPKVKCGLFLSTFFILAHISVRGSPRKDKKYTQNEQLLQITAELNRF